MKLVSIDLKADFAFFRKPETNNTINLSYNIIHRPAILGILGAILGLDGFKEKGKLPEYYQVLKSIKIGVEPLKHEKGNYAKTNIKYTNTIGYANKGNNFLTEELTLIAPEFRIYLLVDQTNQVHVNLLQNLKAGKAEYIPYLGKNEYTAWWEPESFKEYQFTQEKFIEDSIVIKSVFEKQDLLKGIMEGPIPDLLSFESFVTPFVYFERLPKDYNLELMQYEMGDFAFSNYQFKNGHTISNLYFLDEHSAYIQLN